LLLHLPKSAGARIMIVGTNRMLSDERCIARSGSSSTTN
jgi:hypothetical protein